MRYRFIFIVVINPLNCYLTMILSLPLIFIDKNLIGNDKNVRVIFF